MNDAESAFFMQLSIFTGGWTLDAADAVCGSGPGPTVDLLGQLVDKSLIQAEPQPDDSIRYGMLETLRQYAAERLLQAGQADEAHRRHALFYAEMIEGRWGRFWIGENTRIRMASVERDYENFRTSLRWLLDDDEVEGAARLAAELTAFWSLGGRVQEGRDWQEQILAAARSSDELSPWRLRLVFGLAQLEAVSGNRAVAYRRLQEILPALRVSDDAPTVAQAVGLAASMAWYMRHDLPAARELALEAVRVAKTTGIRPLEMLERGRLANILVESGEYDAAEQLLTRDATRDWWNAPRATIDLARVHFAKQNYAAAVMLLERLVFEFDPSRTRLEVVLASTVLSWVRLAQGDVVGATDAGTQAVVLVRENLGRTTSPGHLPGPLEALSMVAAADHQPSRALRLAAAAASLRDFYDEGLSPNDRALLEPWLEVARDGLGPQASADAWATGHALDSDAAIREALSTESGPRATALRR